MSKKETKKRRPRKFMVKEQENILVVGAQYFNDIKSREDAFAIGVQVFLELQYTLLQDAVFGSSAMVNTIGLADGLERSLVELERRFPHITEQIRAIDLRNNGVRIGQA